VTGNSPLPEEKRCGDLAVRSTLGHEDGDPTLGGRQPFHATATADAAELGLRLPDPSRRAEIFEARERSLDRLPRKPLLPRPPPDDAEREQRAGPPERVASLVVLLDSPREQHDRLFDVSPCRGYETAAARHAARAPGREEARRIGFPAVDDLDGIVDPAELEQRLGIVARPRPRVRRFPAERCRLPIGFPEALRGRRGVSAPERNESRYRLEQRRMEPDLLLAELQGPLRLVAGELEPAAMDGNPRDRDVVLVLLDAVLNADLAGTFGMVGGQLPTS
jgi:hypothetical protein